MCCYVVLSSAQTLTSLTELCLTSIQKSVMSNLKVVDVKFTVWREQRSKNLYIVWGALKFLKDLKGSLKFLKDFKMVQTVVWPICNIQGTGVISECTVLYKDFTSFEKPYHVKLLNL